MLRLVDKASGLEFRIWEWTMFLDMLVQGVKKYYLAYKYMTLEQI